jgi:hypothetical protein
MKRNVFRLGLHLTALAWMTLVGAVRADERPFKAVGSGATAAGGENSFTAVWSGQATHLGRYDAARAFFQEDGSDLGTATLTGPNGVCHHDPAMCSIRHRTFVGTCVITGGTGRFAGSSGSGSYLVIPDFDPVTTSSTSSLTGQ